MGTKKRERDSRTVILCHQRNGHAALPCARGAAHAVHIRRAVARQVVINYPVHARDIEAAGGNVGRDEDVARSGAEFIEGTQAGGLGELACFFGEMGLVDWRMCLLRERGKY